MSLSSGEAVDPVGRRARLGCFSGGLLAADGDPSPEEKTASEEETATVETQQLEPPMRDTQPTLPKAYPGKQAPSRPRPSSTGGDGSEGLHGSEVLKDINDALERAKRECAKSAQSRSDAAQAEQEEAEALAAQRQAFETRMLQREARHRELQRQRHNNELAVLARREQRQNEAEARANLEFTEKQRAAAAAMARNEQSRTDTRQTALRIPSTRKIVIKDDTEARVLDNMIQEFEDRYNQTLFADREWRRTQLAHNPSLMQPHSMPTLGPSDFVVDEEGGYRTRYKNIDAYLIPELPEPPKPQNFDMKLVPPSRRADPWGHHDHFALAGGSQWRHHAF